MRPYGVLGLSIAGNHKRSPEYPCVSRFRQRRLLTFLLGRNFLATYRALISETDVFMSLEHLLGLVEAGLWNEAIKYLSRFLPSDRLLGIHGRVLFHFLRVHKAIADILAGAQEARPVAAALDQCLVRFETRNHGLIKLRAILTSLIHSRFLRTSLDMRRVWLRAALIIADLAYQIPELKDHMAAAGGQMEPHVVLPVGFGYASFRPRRQTKKPGRIPPSAVARLYLQKKKKLPSSISIHSGGITRESLIKAKEWMVNLVGTCLEDGKLHRGHPSQSNRIEGYVAPASQATVGAFTKPTNHSGSSSSNSLGDLFEKAKEWMFYLAEECLEAWPDLRQEYPLHSDRKNDATVAGASQSMRDTLSRPAEDSTIKSLTEAGAHVSLVSQIIPETLTRHAVNSKISAVTTAGAYNEHSSHAECARLNFGSRKNPRMELPTVGQDCDPKRQRITLGSLIGTEGKRPIAA